MDEDQSSVTFKFVVALMRRLALHADPAALDVYLLKAARDVGAKDSEIRALRTMLTKERAERRKKKWEDRTRREASS